MASNGINLQAFSEINLTNRQEAITLAKRLADGVANNGMNETQKQLGQQLSVIADKLGAASGLGSTRSSPSIITSGSSLGSIGLPPSPPTPPGPSQQVLNSLETSLKDVWAAGDDALLLPGQTQSNMVPRAPQNPERLLAWNTLLRLQKAAILSRGRTVSKEQTKKRNPDTNATYVSDVKKFLQEKIQYLLKYAGVQDDIAPEPYIGAVVNGNTDPYNPFGPTGVAREKERTVALKQATDDRKRALMSDTMRSKPNEPTPASDMAAQTAERAKKIQNEAEGAARKEVARQEALKEKEDAEKRAQNARVNAMEEALRAKQEATKNAAAIARIVSSAQSGVGTNNLNVDTLSQRLIKAKEAVKKNISRPVRIYQQGARKNVLAAQAAAKKDGATDAELLDFLQKYEEYEKNIETADLELKESLDKASKSSSNAIAGAADKSAYSTNLQQIENLLKTTNPNIPTLRNSVTALKKKYNIPELNNKADILLARMNEIASAEAANIQALNDNPLHTPTTNAGRREQERRTQQREASAARGNLERQTQAARIKSNTPPTVSILGQATRNFGYFNRIAQEKAATLAAAAINARTTPLERSSKGFDDELRRFNAIQGAAVATPAANPSSMSPYARKRAAAASGSVTGPQSYVGTAPGPTSYLGTPPLMGKAFSPLPDSKPFASPPVSTVRPSPTGSPTIPPPPPPPPPPRIITPAEYTNLTAEEKNKYSSRTKEERDGTHPMNGGWNIADYVLKGGGNRIFRKKRYNGRQTRRRNPKKRRATRKG